MDLPVYDSQQLPQQAVHCLPEQLVLAPPEEQEILTPLEHESLATRAPLTLCTGSIAIPAAMLARKAAKMI